MKKFLFLFIFLIPTLAICQNRKNTSKGKEVLTEEQLKSKTLKWFKDVYVQQNWKDPYSFKLMKCTLTPVLFGDHLKLVLIDFRDKFNEVDTTLRAGVYNKAKWNTKAKKKQYDDDLLGIDSSKVYFSELEYKRALYQENELKKMHNSYVADIANIDSIQKHSSKKLLNMTYQYRVDIDAYGKNGYGNSVLSRYYYIMDTTGVLISDVKRKE